MISGIRHILLDIEGTTCPVSFVSEVLFPYARRQVEPYLQRHGHEADIQKLLQELQQSWQQEVDSEAMALLRQGQEQRDSPSDEESATADDACKTSVYAHELLPYLHWLIQRDRKVSAWKELQGKIWQEGYACGDLQADLYPDVAVALRHWKQTGRELSVYSSGSVAAQKLLYGHCREGDLRSLFSHWFDTRIGPKQEKSSYEAILRVIEQPSNGVLFISDAVRELQAAEAAGLQVVFSDREGNPERDPSGYRAIGSLEELCTEVNGG